MTDWLMDILGGIPLSIKIIIASCIPVTELRAAIPVGIAMGIPPLEAYFLGVIGNIIPIIPLLLVVPPLYRFLSRIRLFQRFLGEFIERTRAKGRQVEKYGALGLLIFVAIPLPGTGVWTGSLLAFIMGINFWLSLVALSLGVILAGFAITLASIGFLQIFKYIFNLEILAALGLFGIVCWWLVKRWKKKGAP
ncbi:MAG: small multi-drug export protein [Desulfitobacteriaceae bacterium]|nr:small multi-drug export protein [Desulfitobacteriaceae bacterium]MDD4753207.1 small multi-drug export protein [Desulfitobacteriaceae bacterium]